MSRIPGPGALTGLFVECIREVSRRYKGRLDSHLPPLGAQNNHDGFTVAGPHVSSVELMLVLTGCQEDV
jgi:hypothetical protein